MERGRFGLGCAERKKREILGSIRSMVRASLLPFVAVLLLAAFLAGAGVLLPPLPVVLILAGAVGWALRKKGPRSFDDD